MSVPMDVVSDTTTDWRHPEWPTKQAEEPMSANMTDTACAANAEPGAADADASRNPQPTTLSDTPGGPRAASGDPVLVVTEKTCQSPATQPASVNAPAVLDSAPAIDGPVSGSANTSRQQRTQAGDGLADVLPSGQQVVLILVGLVASGKSTFAQALERHFPQFRRCNQDELGDRRSVEALTRQSIREGFSVVVDRTNFDESQRATWIRIAGSVPGTLVWVIVFDTPYEVCAARLRNRTGHPTITTPELGLEVLERFQSLFRPPLPHEGYSRILYLKPADLPPTPELSAEDVQGVLQRLQATPEVVQANPPMRDNAYGGYGWRGGYNRGYRDDRGDRGGYQPRGFAPRGAPAYRGDRAQPGGSRDGYRDEGRSHWNTRTRGSGSFYAFDGGASSSGWRGQSSPRGSPGHYPSPAGDVSDHPSDRAERNWRRLG